MISLILILTNLEYSDHRGIVLTYELAGGYNSERDWTVDETAYVLHEAFMLC